LNELIEDILNVARLEQDRLPIRLSTFDVAALATTLVDQYRVLVAAKNLTVEFTPGAAAFVKADQDRTKQILTNLLSNAVKYTEKGKVEVLVRSDDEAIRVTVADTGFGISAEALPHLFEKFYRVRTESTARIAGTGLGLWISREIARKMGGDLSVESIAGVGSHFTVTLPHGHEEQKDEDRRV
jgi:signal transduction histidine kinase